MYTDTDYNGPAKIHTFLGSFCGGPFCNSRRALLSTQKRYGCLKEIWMLKRDMDAQKRYGCSKEIWMLKSGQ